MRYPKHIVVDTFKLDVSNSSKRWVGKYRSSFDRTRYFSSSLNLIKPSKSSSNLRKKYVRTSLLQNATFKFRFVLRTAKKSKTARSAIFPRSPITFRSKVVEKPITRFRRLAKLCPELAFDELIDELNLEKSSSKKIPFLGSTLLWDLFDINFLKREKLYTKLKYSRSPAYDIVSGGVAALFAGFLGFLISEKFGIELVDSGDFYIFFMYTTFLLFTWFPFRKFICVEETIWSFASPKFIFSYFYTLLILILRLFNRISPRSSLKFWKSRVSSISETLSKIQPPKVYFNSGWKFLRKYLR